MKMLFSALLTTLMTSVLLVPSSRVCASEVSAFVLDRTLYVQGTPNQDEVWLVFFSTGIEYEESWLVSGVGFFDAAEFDAIDVNLGAGDDCLFMRFWQGIPPQTRLNINLGAGNDFLEMGEGGYTTSILTFAGDISIQGGPGNDIISILTVNILGDLVVNSGPGDDQVGVNGLTVGGDVSVTTGAGDDRVLMGGSWNRFLASLFISTGSGNDLVVFESVMGSVGGDLEIQMGGGDDILSFVLNHGVTGNLTLDGGANADQLWFPNATTSLGKVGGEISIENFESVFDEVYDWFE